MKKSLFFRQKKPLTVIILGTMFLVFVLWFLAEGAGSLSQLVVMGLLGLLLLGYSISYEIVSDGVAKKHFGLFGLSLFRGKLHIPYSEYLCVVKARYKQGAEWGPVASLGKERSGETYAIRLFNGNKHFTVYRTSSLQGARLKAEALSDLLGIELREKN